MGGNHVLGGAQAGRRIAGSQARATQGVDAEREAELEARDQPRTGNKAWLRRRLQSAIVRSHLEAVSSECD